jgi:hypothetical protein
VLLANYLDESLQRNTLAYNLSGAMGMEQMETVFVDVVLNGDFVGNYQLCENIRVDPTRVDIFDWEDEAEKAFRLLIVGSNLMDDYSCASVFTKLVAEAQGRTVISQYVTSSTFVINDLVNEKDDLGLRSTLAEVDWDAVVIQISSRCTKSASDVEASELAALREVMPLFKAETDKIFLFTLNSKSKPGIFTTASGDPGYTDTGAKETYSAAEGSAYFKSLADRFASEFGLGVINYGEAYLELSSPEKIDLGYLQGCMLYNGIFAEALPAALTHTNGVTAAKAETLRKLAEKYCLG